MVYVNILTCLIHSISNVLLCNCSRPGDELTSRINSNTSDPDRPSETDGQSGPRPVSNLYETYHPLSLYDIDEAPFSSGAALSTMSTRGSHIDAMDTGALVAKAPSADDSTISAEPYVDPQSPAQSATNRLAEALQKLRHVDMILDQLGNKDVLTCQLLIN